MRSTNKVEQSATPATAGLETRFALVRAFLIDRRVANYLSVFAACGVQLTNAEAERIRQCWNAKSRVKSGDEGLIVRLEAVIEHLKAA